MRIAFVKTLLELAKKDKRIMLLTGDLGFSVFEEYIKELSKQYINTGVAEQNMTGMAAGLAIENKIPIIYSIVPFITMRNFEQIRNDICYQNLNVKIVGVGAGFSYGPYGHTHHGLEDVGILRIIPNIMIFTPGDPIEVSLVTKLALRHKGPVYIRLGKAGEPNVHQSIPRLQIGKGLIIKEGDDITIMGTSTLLFRANEVSEDLKKMNISVRLISMPTIKPFDKEIIIRSAKKTKAIFSIEEHQIIGGLGSAISEVLAENKIGIIFRRFAVPDRFTDVIGMQEYMRESNGLAVHQIVKSIIKLIK